MALRTPLSVTPHLYMGDSTGRPLDKGVVYFGEQDKDPEFYPINLFSDDALTLPLAQPVHTKGGYLYDKGDMVEPHAKEIIYSVKVLDSYGRKVFYKGAMMRNSWNDDVINQINQAIVDSQQDVATEAAKAVQVAIDNTAVEGGVLADTFVTATANGVGTVARTQRDVNSDSIHIKDFGAKCDGITDDTTAFRLAIVYASMYKRDLNLSGTILVTDELNDGAKRIRINGNSAFIKFDNAEVDSSGNATKCLFRWTASYEEKPSFFKGVTVTHVQQVPNQHTFIFDSCYIIDLSISDIVVKDSTGYIFYLVGNGEQYSPGFHHLTMEGIKGYDVGGIVGQHPNTTTWCTGVTLNGFALERTINGVSPCGTIANLKGFREGILDSWILEGAGHPSTHTGVYLDSTKMHITNLYLEVTTHPLTYSVDSNVGITVNGLSSYLSQIRLRKGHSVLNDIDVNGAIEDYVVVEDGATVEINKSYNFTGYYGSNRPLVPDNRLGLISLNGARTDAYSTYNHNPNVNLFRLDAAKHKPLNVEVDDWKNGAITKLFVVSTSDAYLEPVMIPSIGRVIKCVRKTGDRHPEFRVNVVVPENLQGSQLIISTRVKIDTTAPIGEGVALFDATERNYSVMTAMIKEDNGDEFHALSEVNTLVKENNTWQDMHIIFTGVKNSVEITIKPKNWESVLGASDTMDLYISDLQVNIGADLPDLSRGNFDNHIDYAPNIPPLGYYIRGDVIYNTGVTDVVGWRRKTTGTGNALSVDWVAFGASQ